MNWKQAIEQLDMSEKNSEYVNVDQLMRDLDISGYIDEYKLFDDKRLSRYWITSWICTDTRVGLSVYIFNDIPVAVSARSCRKCDEHIEFVSIEAANTVRQVLLNYVEHDDTDISIVNINQDIEPFWFKRGQ